MTWVLENHDVTRIVTRFGEREARAAALLLLALPGPVFLYQGQELGLEEVDLPDEVRQDPIFERTGGERKGRDGCRVPLPWTRDAAGALVAAAAGVVGREVRRGAARRRHVVPRSYRRAIELRPSGALRVARLAPGALVFERDGVVCAVNVSAEPFALPEGRLLLASEPLTDALPPGAAAWIGTGP